MKSCALPLILLALCGCTNHSHSHSESGHDHDEDENHNSSYIHLSSEQEALLGIETERLQAGAFQDVIKVGGEIESSLSDTYTVTAHKSGIVTLAPDLTPGTTVSRGQRIATVSPQGMQGGDASQASAANLVSAKAEYERLKPLYEEKLVTAATFREAERAYNEALALSRNGAPGGSVAETSPAAGIITSLYATSGRYLEAGEPIALISGNTSLSLRADLPAKYAAKLPTIVSANFIPAGSDTALSLDSLNGKRISGNTPASSNGYIPVYFSFSGNSTQSPPGFSEVFLLGAPRQGVISVPVSALVEIQGNMVVYVKKGDGEYEKRVVKTGASDGSRTEIIEGINEGEEVVAKGASIVRMAEISSIAPPAHNHTH